MRVPISWLSDFVELPDDLDGLAEGLSHQGVKVESVLRAGEGIEDIVVGEVMKISDHPDSDRLVLAEVDWGSGAHQVVVGVRNFSEGDKVPVAAPGATLPGVGEVGVRSIRGEKSHGMLCSPKELGLSEDHSGILILGPEAEIGVSIAEHLGLPEIIFELDITPNRPDVMGLLGLAREVAVLTDGSAIRPAARLGYASTPTSSVTSVDIVDVDGCPRYLAMVLDGIAIAPSPELVQRRLSAAGIRPVSNVVDATNYVLWITGQPLHAFDRSKLDEGRIVVRRARADEEIRTLDGEDRRLSADDLVIADANKAVAIAGIMGGLETEVSSDTTEILLESAYFEPRGILRSSRRHGLRTEASSRFERGVDPGGIPYAAELAASLIAEWSGGGVHADPIDQYPKPQKRATVSVSVRDVNTLLGTELDEDQVRDSLIPLGFELTRDSDEGFDVTVPSWRPDVSITEDLVEEVARIVGYDTIPTTIPAKSGRVGQLGPMDRWLRDARAALLGAGLTEAYTSSFISEEIHARMGYPQGHPFIEPVRIANPISEDEALLRPSLLPGLLRSVGGNVARRRLEVALFEIGICFLPSDEVLPEESLRLGMVLHGETTAEWHTPSRELDLFDLKGCVEALFVALGIEKATWRHHAEHGFHPGRSAEVMIDEKRLGVAGELSPSLAEHYGLSGRTPVAELSVEALMEAPSPRSGVAAPKRFPPVLLDLAVVVSVETPASEVLEVARANGGELLEDVRLFDQYLGEQLDEGKKSLAMSLSFRADDRTLTESEAMDGLQKVKSALADRFGAEERS